MQFSNEYFSSGPDLLWAVSREPKDQASFPHVLESELADGQARQASASKCRSDAGVIEPFRDPEHKMQTGAVGRYRKARRDILQYGEECVSPRLRNLP